MRKQQRDATKEALLTMDKNDRKLDRVVDESKRAKNKLDNVLFANGFTLYLATKQSRRTS